MSLGFKGEFRGIWGDLREELGNFGEFWWDLKEDSEGMFWGIFGWILGNLKEVYGGFFCFFMGLWI